MKLALSEQQCQRQAAYRSFVQQEIAPFANDWDLAECVPRDAIQRLAGQGYLGALLPESVGGLGLDMQSFGMLHEEVGSGCSSMRSLLTVHSMFAYAIHRWGGRGLKEQWLESLASGAALGAFALTEPNVGSDAQSVETTATPHGAGFVLSGHKRWITFGQIADAYLVFARCEGKPTAFVLERTTPGLSVEPMHGSLGTRASMLAELHIDGCEVSRSALVGGIGFGFAAVGASALDIGRFSIACGSVGIGQACLDASLQYASERSQFGSKLKDHQLIAQMITNMVTNVEAARLLCYRAGYLKDVGDMGATTAILMAKYFASSTAARTAADAVQIHGANGCGPAASVQRHFRDAKIMEIIEGSSQIQQITIARHAVDRLSAAEHPSPALRAV